MARDLGAPGFQVHEQAEAVIRFWLEETPAEVRFARSDALDAEIRDRFAGLRAQVLASHCAGWRSGPRILLAAIILLDQFSRNLFRDDPRAYEGDPMARALAREGVERGWDKGMSADERQFLHMPFMHSEGMDDQLLSLRLFGAGNAWAPPHAAQVARFTRFPQRNGPLERETTAEEAAFLAEPGNHF